MKKKLRNSFLSLEVFEMGNSKRNGTQTSSFGVSKRENHDSSKFYNSKLYEGVNKRKKVNYVENKIDKKFLNRNFCKSSEKYS